MSDIEAQLVVTVTTLTSTTKGGQHRSPAGVNVLDSETPAERAERHRRVHAELDREEFEALDAFEAERAETNRRSDEPPF